MFTSLLDMDNERVEEKEQHRAEEIEDETMQDKQQEHTKEVEDNTTKRGPIVRNESIPSFDFGIPLDNSVPIMQTKQLTSTEEGEGLNISSAAEMKVTQKEHNVPQGGEHNVYEIEKTKVIESGEKMIEKNVTEEEHNVHQERECNVP